MLFTLKWSLSVLGWEISPMKSYGYHGRTQWGLCTIYTYIETIKQTAQFDKKKHAFVIGPFFHCKTFVPRRARLWWPSWAHSRCGTRVHLNLSVKTQAFRTNDEGAPSSSTPQLWAPPLQPSAFLATVSTLVLSLVKPVNVNFCSIPPPVPQQLVLAPTPPILLHAPSGNKLMEPPLGLPRLSRAHLTTHWRIVTRRALQTPFGSNPLSLDVSVTCEWPTSIFINRVANTSIPSFWVNKKSVKINHNNLYIFASLEPHTHTHTHT